MSELVLSEEPGVVALPTDNGNGITYTVTERKTVRKVTSAVERAAEVLGITFGVFAVAVYLGFIIWGIMEWSLRYDEDSVNQRILDISKSKRIPRLPLFLPKDWGYLVSRWSLKTQSSAQKWIESWTPRAMEQNRIRGHSAKLSPCAQHFYNEFSPYRWRSYCKYENFLLSLTAVCTPHLWKDFLFYCSSPDHLESFLRFLANKRDTLVSLSRSLALQHRNSGREDRMAFEIQRFFAYVFFLAETPGGGPLQRVLLPEAHAFVRTQVRLSNLHVSEKSIRETEDVLVQLATEGTKVLPVPLVHLVGEYLISNGIPEGLGRHFSERYRYS